MSLVVRAWCKLHDAPLQGPLTLSLVDEAIGISRITNGFWEIRFDNMYCYEADKKDQMWPTDKCKNLWVIEV